LTGIWSSSAVIGQFFHNRQQFLKLLGRGPFQVEVPRGIVQERIIDFSLPKLIQEGSQ
jgi:hypothetical protein